MKKRKHKKMEKKTQRIQWKIIHAPTWENINYYITYIKVKKGKEKYACENILEL